MCALTFARRFRYNTSKLPRDGASAVADQVRCICGRWFNWGGYSVRFRGDPVCDSQSGWLEGRERLVSWGSST